MALLCPLWVVNATSLAIDAAIVQMEAPPQRVQSSGGSTLKGMMKGAPKPGEAMSQQKRASADGFG